MRFRGPAGPKGQHRITEPTTEQKSLLLQSADIVLPTTDGCEIRLRFDASATNLG
jgi:hypothetical protein